MKGGIFLILGAKEVSAAERYSPSIFYACYGEGRASFYSGSLYWGPYITPDFQYPYLA
jgi:hypothetical protein